MLNKFKKEKNSTREQVKKVTIYHDTFKHTVTGRAVLKDLMVVHGMLSSCFDPNPLEMARKEGERNVVIRILSILETSASELRKLMEEREYEE